MGISLGYSGRFLFGSDDGIIISSAYGEVLGSTHGIDEGSYMGFSDGSLIVLMILRLRVYCLSNHVDNTLKLYWVIFMELKMRAQHWECHLGILRVRRLALKQAWYLELVKYTCSCRQL